MKTILVIDDDDGIRKMLSAFLRKHRWRVLEAEGGQQGIELARKQLPQAILCDLLMPGTNGFRVCSAIRGDRTLRYSLLVAMSGRAFEDNRRSALEAGADEFLVKPIDMPRLLSLLERTTASVPPRRLAQAESEEVGQGLLLRFWGVRGSIPVPGPGTVRYGGNTACVELRAGGEIIILDAGTGIRPLGDALVAEFADQPHPLTLLITHAHWDHVQGFPFFKPAYEPGWHLRVLGFESAGETLAAVFARQMEAPYFPINLGQLPAHPQFEELASMEFAIGRVRVKAAFVNHPGVCAGYRLSADGVSVAYVPDHEPFHRSSSGRATAASGTAAREAEAFVRSEDERIIEFLHGADVLILDSQFDSESYAAHMGWGHSSVEDAVDLAVRAEVKRLFLFHHDPSHHDTRMDRVVESARKLAAKSGRDLEVQAAQEGVVLELPAAARTKHAGKSA